MMMKLELIYTQKIKVNDEKIYLKYLIYIHSQIFLTCEKIFRRIRYYFQLHMKQKILL